MADTTTEVPITLETGKHIASGLLEGAPQGLSPTVKAAVEAVRNGQAEKALQMVAVEVIPFNQEDVDELLLENLSSEERDPKTGQKNEPKSSREKKRYEDSRNTAKAIMTYLENPQDDPPQELLIITYSYLSSSPFFRELIFDNSGLNTGNAEAIAKTLLREPQVREAIRRLYIERLDPKKRLPHEKEVIRLEQEVKRIMAELGEDIEQLIRDKRTEIQSLNSQIQALPEFQSYQTLQSQLEELISEKEAIRQEYERLAKIQEPNEKTQERMRTISESIKDLDVKIKSQEQQIINFQNDSTNRDLFNKINNLTQLNQELQTLEQKRTVVDPERRRRLQEELAEKQAELQEARALLTAERIKYAGEIQSIVPEAIKSYLDEAFKKATTVLREETKKEAEKKETADKEALSRAVDKIVARIGRKEKRKGGMTLHIPDKKEAAKLLQKLLLPDGIDKLFDTRSGELRLFSNYLTQTYNLTAEEASVFIETCKNDPAYQRQIASKMAQAVFADYIGQGGRLSKDIVVALTTTEWGKQLLEEGQKLVKERRAELEKLFETGVISGIDELKGKTGEWIKGNWWKVGGGIALLVLLFLLGKAGAGALLPG